MKIITSLFLLLFFSSVYYGCVNSGNTSVALLSGNYKYALTDSLNAKLVEGVITFKDFTDNKISGTYTKEKIMTGNFPGYSTMQGNFGGTFDAKENKGFINTNPKIADRNIFINFEIKNDSLTGEWSLSTMMGIQNHGNFYAVKMLK